MSDDSTVVGRRGVKPMADETRAIMVRLRDTQVGDLISWDELEAITGASREKTAAYCRTAAKKLENEEKIHFQVSHGAGYKRVSHQEAATIDLPKKSDGIRRAANRVIKKGENIILDEVRQEDRIGVIGRLTLAHMTRDLHTQKKLKQLETLHKEEQKLTPFTPKMAMQKLGILKD